MSKTFWGSIAYSIIIPILNEESVLPKLIERVDSVLADLDGPAEVIFVDDGSTDRSAAIVTNKAEHDSRYRLVSLSRNFGHQIAIIAGMELASGNAAIVMDADLQDPPELINEMVSKWKSGNEIVVAERLSRHGESLFKRVSADLFYRVLRWLALTEIPRNVGDFRLVDRKVLEVLKRMGERDPFVRGMFGWMGFRQTSVTFHRPRRAHGGTKYPFHKMIGLSLHALVGFSDAPLRFALWLGLGISAIAGMLCLYVVTLTLYDTTLVQGWASTVVIISFLCGVNLLMTGIVGLYVGQIHTEVKKRPRYVITQTVGFENSPARSRQVSPNELRRTLDEPAL
jgi:polyisoprenyl-phosphate glycosyltransferase